jgi:hypothetical protein
MLKNLFFLQLTVLSFLLVSAEDIYVNPKSGNDLNTGTKLQPLKSIAEAAKRVNANSKREASTIILAEGVYNLTETVLFNNNKFSADNRLTIRAEILPDDATWSPQRMPIVASAIPGTTTPGDGEEARGFEFEVSHVTIEGLRFTGSPVYYYIDGKQSRRYYPVWREGKNLDDLLVTQCLFAGNIDVMPIRVAVIANGNGLVLDHCVFFNCENSVVYWETDGGVSHHDAMRYCLVYESHYSGVWTTTNTADDFEFHHNIIANSKAAWIRDDQSTHRYQVHDCIYTNNVRLTGNGRQDTINHDFLTMANVQLSGNIDIEKDQGKNNYLQLKDGSFGSELKAGLFKK